MRGWPLAGMLLMRALARADIWELACWVCPSLAIVDRAFAAIVLTHGSWS